MQFALSATELSHCFQAAGKFAPFAIDAYVKVAAIFLNGLADVVEHAVVCDFD